MWIHFNGDEPLRWLRDHAFQLRQVFPIIENPVLFRAQLEHLLTCVHRNPTANSPNYSRLAIGLLAHFLRDLPPGSASSSREVPDEAVKQAVEYIWNFSHDIVDVPAVVRQVGVPRRTLDRRFKAATGRSILQEIQFCRVSRAARLLQETRMPVKHVVHRAGFRSDEHLRLAFQAAFGRSPQAYRKMR